MRFKSERRFFEGLCKGQILDLITDVGWTPIQCAMVRKKYLEFKSMPVICMETGQSESQYSRNLNKIFEKLKSHLQHNS